MQKTFGVVRLPIGWPLIALVHGYVLVWLLGLQEFAWPFIGLALGFWVVSHRRMIVVPAGFGIWMLFLGWTVVSAVMLVGLDRIAAWGYRESMYFSATLLLLFFVNVSEKELPTRTISRMILSLWMVTIAGGYLGITFPDTQITSLAEVLLPESVRQIGFVISAVDPRLGSTAEFLGVPRPIMPFSYTNQWGAALGILTPLAMFARYDLRSRWAANGFWVLLLASVVPVIVSVNRGLWVSLCAVAVLFLLRSGLGGRFATTVVGLVVLTAGAAIVWFTPLRDVVIGRLETPNTGTRETLAGAAVNLTAESPLIGFGAPVQETFMADTNDVSVGTHGQLWTLLVSHGIPGAAFFIGFFLIRALAALQASARGWWAAIAIFVFLIQMPFYNALPVPLMLAMIAIALCMRDSGIQNSTRETSQFRMDSQMERVSP